MKSLAAVVAIIVFALPAVAGPLDTWQYRATLSTNLSPGTGPALGPGETAYALGDSPAFGVVTSSVPGWQLPTPAYPSANFALVHLGALTPYISTDPEGVTDLHGAGRYSLSVEIRDAEGRVGVVSFNGAFTAGWSHGHGYAGPDFDPMPQSLWLGHTRYLVQVMYGMGGPYYVQDESGNWYPGWYAVDPVPAPSGSSTIESSGEFIAFISPTPTPEPGTLLLAAVGFGSLVAVRRFTRARVSCAIQCA